MSQELKNNKDLRDNVHGKYFDHLYKKFGGNVNHVAHAWKNGPENTVKHLNSGKTTKDDASVKKFFE